MIAILPSLIYGDKGNVLTWLERNPQPGKNHTMIVSYMQLLLLTLFALTILIRYLLSLCQGVRPILLLKEGKARRERILEMIPVFAVTLIILLILRKIFTPNSGPELAYGLSMPLLVQWLGFLMALGSFSFLFAGYWFLGKNWRVGTGDESQEELITGGIYKLTRNPVYLFFNLFNGGLFLLNGDFLIFFLMITIVFSLHFMIINEEKMLYAQFGQQYVRYINKTPRYFDMPDLKIKKV